MTNEELSRTISAERYYQIREKLAKKWLRELMEDLEFSTDEVLNCLRAIEVEDREIEASKAKIKDWMTGGKGDKR
jgi:hypothetical protein